MSDETRIRAAFDPRSTVAAIGAAVMMLTIAAGAQPPPADEPSAASAAGAATDRQPDAESNVAGPTTSSAGDAATVIATVEATAQVESSAVRDGMTQLVERQVTAYCQHVHARGESEQAVLRSPWVALRGSTLQRGELQTGLDDDPLSPRVRAGAGFSVSDWLRADLLEDFANANCELYRAEQDAEDVESDLDVLTVGAWQAEASTLERAVSVAETLVTESARQMTAGERTVEKHLRLLGDFERLHQALATALARVARLSTARAPQPLPEARIDELRRRVQAVERAEGALRRNRALSLDIEAGYDEILGVDQQLPLYGQLNLTFRPGYFWQERADEASAAAAGEAAVLRASRARADFQLARARARAEDSAMRAQVGHLRGYVRTLEQQYQLLQGVPNQDAKFLVERLWFELELSRARLTRFETALDALTRWLSDNPVSGAEAGHVGQ